MTDKKNKVLNVLVVVVAVGLFVLLGRYLASDLARNDRVSYAMNETLGLRAAVGDFYVRQHAWPRPQDLGVPATVAYPGGGNYRLLAGGEIVISFVRAEGLKGQTIRLHPRPAADGLAVSWECSASSPDLAERARRFCGY